jgi:hypothetical protein
MGASNAAAVSKESESLRNRICTSLVGLSAYKYCASNCCRKNTVSKIARLSLDIYQNRAVGRAIVIFRDQPFRSSFGSFAKLAAMRRALPSAV